MLEHLFHIPPAVHLVPRSPSQRPVRPEELAEDDPAMSLLRDDDAAEHEAQAHTEEGTPIEPQEELAHNGLRYLRSVVDN
eukprot:3063722-Alexandrium_andersonii.AAC.1